MYQERKNFAITADYNQQNIYVFGGQTEIALDQCEKYSIIKDEWTILSPMNQQKSGASACIPNKDFIFVLGGYSCDCKYLRDIEVYDIAGNEWMIIKNPSIKKLERRQYAFLHPINPS